MAGDPNWFYSSLAQSAAAIVGLIGAFVGSRVIEQVARVRDKREDLKMRIGSYEVRRQEEVRGLKRYQRDLNSELDKNRAALAEGLTQRRADHLINYSQRTGTLEMMHLTDEYMAELQSLVDYATKAVDLLERISFANGVQAKESFWIDELDGLRSSEPTENHHQIGSKTQECLNELLPTHREYRRYLSQVVPGSFVVGIGLMTALAVVGVVLPLAELTGTGRYKWVLLSLFTACLVSLFIFFAYQIIELRRVGTEELTKTS